MFRNQLILFHLFVHPPCRLAIITISKALQNCGSNLKNGKKIFVYLFEQLGGFQIRYWQLEGSISGRVSNVDEDLEAIDRGFDLIEGAFRRREVVPSGLCLLRWITKQINTPDGPLYKWSERLVEKAFSRLSNEGTLAKEVTNCPYTLKSFQPFLVDTILVDLVPHLTTRSIGFVGKAGCGKSPVVEGLACAFSRYWKKKNKLEGAASYRVACDLDFFRGDVGTVDRPDALDDCDPQTITPSKWKAFCDVGLVESMTRERWGASKWVRNQLRLWAVNPFDDTMERDEGDRVPHGEFMFLMNPLWHKHMDHESKLAVVKRSCIVVVTNRWIYWRPAGEEEVDVKRLRLNTSETGNTNKLVDSSANDVVSSWKEGKLKLPDDHEEQLAWEECWMNATRSCPKASCPFRVFGNLLLSECKGQTTPLARTTLRPL